MDAVEQHGLAPSLVDRIDNLDESARVLVLQILKSGIRWQSRHTNSMGRDTDVVRKSSEVVIPLTPAIMIFPVTSTCWK
jgi:hypothetical protein